MIENRKKRERERDSNTLSLPPRKKPTPPPFPSSTTGIEQKQKLPISPPSPSLFSQPESTLIKQGDHQALVNRLLLHRTRLNTYFLANAKSKLSYTFLHWAIIQRQVKCVKVLLELGADPNLRVCGGWNNNKSVEALASDYGLGRQISRFLMPPFRYRLDMIEFGQLCFLVNKTKELPPGFFQLPPPLPPLPIRERLREFQVRIREVKRQKEGLTEVEEVVEERNLFVRDCLENLDKLFAPESQTMQQLFSSIQAFLKGLNVRSGEVEDVDVPLEITKFQGLLHSFYSLLLCAAEEPRQTFSLQRKISKLGVRILVSTLNKLSSHGYSLDMRDEFSELYKDLQSIQNRSETAQSLFKKGRKIQKKIKTTHLTQLKLKMAQIEAGGNDDLTCKLKEVMEEERSLHHKLSFVAFRAKMLVSHIPEASHFLHHLNYTSELEKTGLIVQHSLSSYEILESLSPNQLLAKFNETLWVLKKRELKEEESFIAFKEQIFAIHNLDHPLLLSLHGIFFDEENNIAYMIYPYVSGGSLTSWLNTKSPRKSHELRPLFHQILQGIAYLHSHSTFHGNISAENILVQENNRPIIINYAKKEHPKNLDSARIPPEMMNGDDTIITKASDLWQFGILLFRAVFPTTEPILLPGKNVVEIPEACDYTLSSLLCKLLQRDPEKRYSAHHSLIHPFFVSTSEGKFKELLNSHSGSTISAFLEHLGKLKEGKAHKLTPISIRKRQLVEDTLLHFEDMRNDTFFCPIDVTFAEEPGVDEGGLTSELYSLFFGENTSSSILSVFDPHFGYFEKIENSPFFLPHRKSKRSRVYRVLGKILIKCIIDRRTIPPLFAPAIFKYLCGVNVDLSDMELCDKEFAKGLREMLNQPLASQGLEGCYTFDGMKKGGKDIIVTDQNKEEWVQLRIKKELVDVRDYQLDQMKRGFWIKPLSSHLRLLTPEQLQSLLCGEGGVTAERVIKILTFVDFPTNSETPVHFREIFEEYTSDDITKFLRFVTGMPCIPTHSDFRIQIKCVQGRLKREMIPQAHTCVSILDLPDYNDKAVLKEKMKVLLSWSEDCGFGFG